LPAKGIGRGQGLEITGVEAGAPGQIGEVPEGTLGARGDEPAGAGAGQALDHAETSR
jgi:hypothetical protein